MDTPERTRLVPALPLLPAQFRQERRLLRGAAEKAMVQVLVAQRERYCQSGGRVPLCLTQEELAQQLGLPCETVADHQRAWEALRKAIRRVNAKLATQNLIIGSVHLLGMTSPRYAIFPLHEVWA